MSIDPAASAGLRMREVRTGVRAGATTRIVVARRTYPAEQADLWQALTDAERLPRWFLPVTGDLSVGGRYQVVGNAGGVVESCTPPESFAVTWEFGEMVSWLKITLIPESTGTTLELAHESAVDPQMWGEFGPGAVGVGWDLALWGLGLHVESGAPVSPELGAGFPLTPEGREFVRQAATGWAEAAAADGDEPGAADEAAARTAAFYTTVPETPPEA